MENFNFSEFGVEKLNTKESKKVNGGGIVAGILVGVTVAAIYDIAANHEQFVKGFKEGAYN